VPFQHSAASPTKYYSSSREIVSVDDLNASYLNMAVQWGVGHRHQAEGLKKAPPNLPDNAQFFVVRWATRSTVMLVLPGKSPKLYVDVDMDSDLSDEKPITGKSASGREQWALTADMSLPAYRCRPPAQRGDQRRARHPGYPAQQRLPGGCSKNYLSGTVEVKGKKYRVRLSMPTTTAVTTASSSSAREAKDTKTKRKNLLPPMTRWLLT